MTILQEAMIAEARKRHGQIRFCARCISLEECFTEEDGRLYFWFNTQDGNTRVLVEGRVV